jgi:hypothetical protein
LEGSRLEAYAIDQAYIYSIACLAETGESRAVPGNDAAFGCSIGSRTQTPDEKVVLGSSWEPPAVAFPGRTRDREERRQQLSVGVKAAPLRTIDLTSRI